MSKGEALAPPSSLSSSLAFISIEIDVLEARIRLPPQPTTASAPLAQASTTTTTSATQAIFVARSVTVSTEVAPRGNPEFLYSAITAMHLELHASGWFFVLLHYHILMFCNSLES